MNLRTSGSFKIARARKVTVQRKLVNEEVTREEVGRWLWGAADIMRGAVRPEKYGDYILPLLFFKRLSDVYLEEYEHAWSTFQIVKKENKDEMRVLVGFCLLDRNCIL